MRKTLGYILAILGIVGIAATVVPEVKTFLSLPDIGDSLLFTISLALALIGIFFIIRKGGRHRKGEEVPIYHGKRVVGYRRR